MNFSVSNELRLFSDPQNSYKTGISGKFHGICQSFFGVWIGNG